MPDSMTKAMEDLTKEIEDVYGALNTIAVKLDRLNRDKNYRAVSKALDCLSKAPDFPSLWPR